jgi:hypothetical protein
VENDAIAARDVYVAQFEEVRVRGFVFDGGHLSDDLRSPALTASFLAGVVPCAGVDARTTAGLETGATSVRLNGSTP